MQSKRNPNKRLFIGSLPYRFTEGDLLSLFISEGKIIDVRIIHNQWGKSRGLGYVEYENLEDAIRAKEKFHNYSIQDRTIIVDFSQPDPFKTEEGKRRHQEALERKKNKFGPRRVNLDEPRVVQKPPNRDPKRSLRQSVYDSRTHGARVGSKFASRTRKKKERLIYGQF